MDMSIICDKDEYNKQLAITELQEQDRVMEMGVSEEVVLQVHEVAPTTSKGEGIICLIYEKVDDIRKQVWLSEGGKSIRGEVDIFAYNEHRLNM